MKKFALGFILLLILCSVLVSLLKINVAKAEPKTIVVPDDYLTIGWAIGNASEGDTIFVKKGTYYEHVTINRAISLIGEDRSSTIIDGNQTGPDSLEYRNVSIVRVIANNVKISGFTIQKGKVGVYLCSYNESVISDNILKDNAYGVGVEDFSSNNMILRNTISQNMREAIHLYKSIGNLIIGNTVIDNGWRTVTNSTFAGIYIWRSDGNIFYHNSFINNTKQVESNYSTNTWDNGYPSGGNYWSDYEDRYPSAKELDGSGVWDTPYVIDGNNQDKHPLMSPHTLPDMQLVYNDLYELLVNYTEVQSKYDGLVASYNSSQTELDDLQSKYNALTNELNITRNIMYAFLITTIVFIATTVYIIMRKPKVKPELKNT